MVDIKKVTKPTNPEVHKYINFVAMDTAKLVGRERPKKNFKEHRLKTMFNFMTTNDRIFAIDTSKNNKEK